MAKNDDIGKAFDELLGQPAGHKVRRERDELRALLSEIATQHDFWLGADIKKKIRELLRRTA